MERRFEALIWKFRLINVGNGGDEPAGRLQLFAIDTYAELSVVSKVLQGRLTLSSSTLLIGKVVGGHRL